MGKVMIMNTHGKEDVERATLAFVVGNAGLSSGQEMTVLLTIDGVWVATKGYADGLQANGFLPLAGRRDCKVTGSALSRVAARVGSPRRRSITVMQGYADTSVAKGWVCSKLR